MIGPVSHPYAVADMTITSHGPSSPPLSFLTKVDRFSYEVLLEKSTSEKNSYVITKLQKYTINILVCFSPLIKLQQILAPINLL